MEVWRETLLISSGFCIGLPDPKPASLPIFYHTQCGIKTCCSSKASSWIIQEHKFAILKGSKELTRTWVLHIRHPSPGTGGFKSSHKDKQCTFKACPLPWTAPPRPQHTSRPQEQPAKGWEKVQTIPTIGSWPTTFSGAGPWCFIHSFSGNDLLDAIRQTCLPHRQSRPVVFCSLHT